MGKEPVGERIREARADRGWKQKELAAEVDVEPITVSRWERGATTPDLDVIRAVADATGKPLGYFIGEEKEIPPQPLQEAVERIEAAAGRIAEQSELIADALAALRE